MITKTVNLCVGTSIIGVFEISADQNSFEIINTLIELEECLKLPEDSLSVINN